MMVKRDAPAPALSRDCHPSLFKSRSVLHLHIAVIHLT
jgi:hypothetical protein